MDGQPGLSLRRATAVAAGKVSGTASRLLGKGGGTALPGIIAVLVAPGIVAELASQLTAGSVLISGTNGKTTTARMLDAILRESGHHPLRNGSGSNLMRGLASSLVQRANVSGNLDAQKSDIGLFEVDEAALAGVIDAIQPRGLLLLDLFRDQLDRYGEVATVAAHWTKAIRDLAPHSILVANGDDPLVTQVASSAMRSPRYFGIGSAEELVGREHASDVKACPRCGGAIQYAAVFLGHQGHYRCTRCDLSRPSPDVEASAVQLRGVSGSTFELRVGDERRPVRLPLPGLYNVYNALGASAMAHALDIKITTVVSALENVTAAFGRMERLELNGRDLYVALAKNPAGLNEVLRTIASTPQPIHLLVMLNDNIADGRDVSWIWDADIEALQDRVASVVFGGTRPSDMALRFKYGEIVGNSSTADYAIEGDATTALRRAIDLTPAGDTLFVVPTYTALLEVRNVLTRLGCARAYWEE